MVISGQQRLLRSLESRSNWIYIAGIRETSLVDVLGYPSFTIWLSFCNFKCPWCSNPQVASGKERQRMTIAELISRLEPNAWIVDYFHVTGGEPTLQFIPLERLFRNIRKRFKNMLISMDTNGSNPQILSGLLPLLDHVAIDVKAPLSAPLKYLEVIGLNRNFLPLVKNIEKSIKIAMNVDFLELRTTLVPSLLTIDDVHKIVSDIRKLLNSNKHNRVVYVIQQFVPYPTIANERFKRMSKTPLKFIEEASKVAKENLEGIEVYSRTLDYGTKRV